jgi:hypothetical protein
MIRSFTAWTLHQIILSNETKEGNVVNSFLTHPLHSKVCPISRTLDINTCILKFGISFASTPLALS